MKATVNEELCVGCGLCVDTCPDTFIMEEDKAKIKANPVPTGSEDSCKKAKEECPVEAIIIEE
ncbi:MAG: ferredoxin [Candidatus Omnitrophota bacterium]|nr:MAG: ferredoxin [Candidatus Omnitrophota bacterium]